MNIVPSMSTGYTSTAWNPYPYQLKTVTPRIHFYWKFQKNHCFANIFINFLHNKYNYHVEWISDFEIKSSHNFIN